MTKEEYWKKLAGCVFEMEDEEIVSLTQEYLDAGYNAFEAVNNGLVEGMNRAGEAFEEEEYFVTDLFDTKGYPSNPICKRSDPIGASMYGERSGTRLL